MNPDKNKNNFCPQGVQMQGVGVVMGWNSRYYQDPKFLRKAFEGGVLRSDLEMTRWRGRLGREPFRYRQELEQRWTELRNRSSKWVLMIGVMGFAICMPVLCFDRLHSAPSIIHHLQSWKGTVNNNNEYPGISRIKEPSSEQWKRLLFISSAVDLELFNGAYTDKVKTSHSCNTNVSPLLVW